MILGAAVVLSGCLEVKDDYVLNPDGSGKVRHEVYFQNISINLGGENQSPGEEMKKAVETLLSQSEGVETWKDVTYELASDGRIHFTGTAYFKSLQEIKFKHGNLTADILEFSWQPQPDGSAILALKDEKEEEDSERAPITDIESEIAAERAKYLQMKPMMMGMLGGMKARATFQLPASPASISGFQKREDGRYEIAVDGEKVMQGINDFIMDDERVREMILQGKSINDQEGMDEALMGEIFGIAGPVQAVVPAGTATFDYTAEVGAAREAYPGMVEALGLTGVSAPAASLPVATGGGFEELRMVGARLAEDTGSNSARPFNWTPGYTLSLAGRLSGRALAVAGGELKAVETLEGRSLLPDSEFQRQINGGSISEDGRLLVWEVEAKNPGQARGLKRVAGTMEYLVAEGEETVDLGFEKLAPGSKGKAMNAVIQSIEKQPWGNEDQYILELKLVLVPDQIKEVEVLGADGRPLPEIGIYSRMTMGENDTTLSIRSKQPYPDNGRVRLIQHANLKKFQVPFELTNIDLLGRPLVP